MGIDLVGCEYLGGCPTVGSRLINKVELHIDGDGMTLAVAPQGLFTLAPAHPILVLGWGDGLAAIVGERRAQAPLRRRSQIHEVRSIRRTGTAFGPSAYARTPVPWLRKTVAGSAAMFGASFAVSLCFTLVFNSRFGAPAAALAVSALTAAAATIVEVLTPLGIDNITVPLATVLLYAGVFA